MTRPEALSENHEKAAANEPGNRDGGRLATAIGAHPHHPHDQHEACSHAPARSPNEATHRDHANCLVSVRQATVVRGGRTLLDGVDLDVDAGEIVTIIGPNGAGKTTLIKVILGLERLQAGRVQRRDGMAVGYVPQAFAVEEALPLTVRRFLSLGTRATPAAIETVLQETGVPHAADRPIQRLSGGETQRVLLARALLRQPELLVLDEPARGVDHVGEADLYALIARLRDARGFGVLLVSHDLNIVMAASDRVLCLNGHVCCSGKPVAVAKHPEYARLFGARAAAALAVYEHDHDHTHDVAGQPLPPHGGAGHAGHRP